MKAKFHNWELRTARIDHICAQCGEKINKDDPYTAITVKKNLGEPNEVFDTIKLHSPSTNNGLCPQMYNKENTWFIKDEENTAVESIGFKKLLDALDRFHKRWQIETSNNLMDRINLVVEENAEFHEAVSKKTNVLEELGDQLGVILGNILWAHHNVDNDISIYGVMDFLTKKLDKRSKFGYKIHNKTTGVTKMTHWQKALNYLEKERDQWQVLSGPKYIHPEIRELLTEKEVEWLEKTGA